MSHYNNSTSSWQNRSSNQNNSNNNNNANNNNNNNVFNNLQSHNDLITAAAAAVASSNLNQQHHPQQLLNNQSGINNGTGLYPVPASLLAQFAVNKVNFNNLAANLPALVNANVLQLQTPSQTTQGYQWHANRLNTNSGSNNNNNNNSNSITSSNTSNQQNGNHNSNNNRQSYSTGNNNNNLNNSSNNNSKAHVSSSGHNNNNTNNKFNNNSSYPSLMEIKNKTPNNQNSSSKSSINNNSSNNNTRNTGTNLNGRLTSGSSSSSSSSNNAQQISVAPTITLSNPIAQALLNQLASSGNNQANSAIVAAALALTQQSNNTTSLLPPPSASSSSSANNSSNNRSSSNSNINKSSSNSNNSNNSNSNRRTSLHRSRSPPARSTNRTSSTNKNDSSSTTNADRRSISISKTNDRPSGGLSSSSNPRSTSKRKTKSRSPIPSSSSGSKSKTSNHVSTTTSSTPHSKSGTYTSSSSASNTATSKRYSIKVPKYSLDYATDNVAGLKNRYPDLYIPSDFTNSNNTWINSLPLNRPLKFNSRCLFHLMNKDAHSIESNTAVYDAPDSDYTWTVKVMLLAMPNVNELVKRACSLAEDNWKEDRFEHPSKVIQFLVGNKGKHELMALGGAWSKSLDGPDPATNTQTLINTATRTVKALTGIDLSSCTQWFRFLDIQYNRNEDIKTVSLSTKTTKSSRADEQDDSNLDTPNIQKVTDETNEKSEEDISSNKIVTDSNGSVAKSDKNSDPKVTTKIKLDLNDDNDIETTVIFVPNIWSLMPNSIEYQKIVEAYKNYIDNPPIDQEEIEPEENKTTLTNIPKQENNIPESDIKSESTNLTVEIGVLSNANQSIKQDTTEATDEPKQEPTDQQEPKDSEASLILKADTEINDNNEAPLTINSLMQSASEEVKPDPTHYSKLDLKKMKVDELRNELLARGLDTKGLKAQLTTRLSKAIQKEKEADGYDQQSNESKEGINQSQDANESVNSLNNNNNNSSNINYDEDTSMQLDNIEAIDIEKQNELSLNPSHENSRDALDVNIAADSTKIAEKTVEGAAEVIKKLDTTTTPDSAAQKPKEITKPKKPVLTKLDLEKLYKLPETPHIIVHPSKTAKNNKFECKLVSLSHLLSYHKEDNKESSFEVSLFAEYFNEMLIRDNGFLIFKHLISVKEDNTVPATTYKRKLSVSNDTNTAENNDSDVKKSKTNEANTSVNKSISNETVAASSTAVDNTVESKETNTSVTNQSNGSTTKISLAAIKTKAKTIFPELLLAFTFFDLNRTNQIYEKDLEDLLLCIGLNLSRSKIKAILKKFKFKDSLLNYRSLTDKVVPLNAALSAIRDSLIYYKLPSDDEIVSNIVNYDSYIGRSIANFTTDQNMNGTNLDVVEINGISIDVMKTVKKLESSELHALTLDQKLKESLEEIERLKIINRNAERQKIKLSDEANDFKKRLRDQQRINKETNDKYIKYKDFVNKTFKTHIRELYDDYDELIGREKQTHSNSSSKTSSTNSKPTETTDSNTKQQQLDSSKTVQNNQSSTEESSTKMETEANQDDSPVTNQSEVNGESCDTNPNELNQDQPVEVTDSQIETQ